MRINTRVVPKAPAASHQSVSTERPSFAERTAGLRLHLPARRAERPPPRESPCCGSVLNDEIRRMVLVGGRRPGLVGGGLAGAVWDPRVTTWTPYSPPIVPRRRPAVSQAPAARCSSRDRQPVQVLVDKVDNQESVEDCHRRTRMNTLYTAEATAIGGREGRVSSSDGALRVDLAVPKELGGAGGHATNPEQLFAAGFAACFDNAVRHVARRKKVRVGEASVTARVGIGPTGDAGFGLTVELHVRLPDLDSDEAHNIVEMAHRVCPYSNAVRGNVEVRLSVDPVPDVI